MNLLLIHSISWVLVIVSSIVAFGLGFLFKSAKLAKQQKRILRLEDEMLANHAHILRLEKKISEARIDPNSSSDELTSFKNDLEQKIS